MEPLSPRRAALLCALVFTSGCGLVTDFDRPIDEGREDAGLIDSGRLDAGSTDGGASDAGTEMDAGGADAGTIDGGGSDAGPRDAGTPDTGAPDAGRDAGGDAGFFPCGGSAGEILLDDVEGIAVEGGEPATYAVLLSQAPVATVTVRLTSPDGQLFAVPDTLTFGPSDFGVAQPVEIHGAHDFEREGGDHSAELHHAAYSPDGCFEGVTEQVGATIADRAHLVHVSQSNTGAIVQGGMNLPAVSDSGDRVVFHSGSDDFVAGDVEGLSDVFLRDVTAGATVRVSENLAGEGGDGPSERPAISADGSSVVFMSRARNLDPLDQGRAGEREAFVFDVATRAIERVTVDCPVACPSSNPTKRAVISGDGRYVAYETSRALVAEDTDAASDIYLYDRVTHATTLVSVAFDGNTGQPVSPSNGDATLPSISRDGQHVAFLSRLGGLFSPEFAGTGYDVVVKHVASGLLERINHMHGSASEPCAGGHGQPYLYDVDFVLYSSNCDYVVSDPPSVTNGVSDLFVRQRSTLRTTRFSVGWDGAQLGSSDLASTGISADGRFAVWRTDSALVVQGDSNGSSDVFVYDTVQRVNTRVSVGPQYEQLPGGIRLNANGMSSDARFVVFQTESDLLPTDQNSGERDVYRIQLF